jgi:hypothetical protein
MRFALVRTWAVVAAALLTGAAADASTEFFENAHWLAGNVRDDQHQGILPALALGAAVSFALLFFVLLARIARHDPLLTRMNDVRRRLVDIAAALCGSMLCVIGIEGYETRFGGLSPFDPRSVVISHTVALIVAFAVVGTMLHCMLRGAVRIASRAGSTVACFVAAFLRKLVQAARSPGVLSSSAFALDARHTPAGVATRSRGMRAPPPLTRPLNFLAT